jgi:hypothetical protein
MAATLDTAICREIKGYGNPLIGVATSFRG